MGFDTPMVELNAFFIATGIKLTHHPIHLDLAWEWMSRGPGRQVGEIEGQQYLSRQFLRDKYAVPASLPQKVACYGIGIPTVAELTCVNNHFPLIFFAVPSRSTWLFAVQLGRPVAEFKDTSK
jgi:hypothetical protein